MVRVRKLMVRKFRSRFCNFLTTNFLTGFLCCRLPLPVFASRSRFRDKAWKMRLCIDNLDTPLVVWFILEKVAEVYLLFRNRLHEHR